MRIRFYGSDSGFFSNALVDYDALEFALDVDWRKVGDTLQATRQTGPAKTMTFEGRSLELRDGRPSAGTIDRIVFREANGDVIAVVDRIDWSVPAATRAIDGYVRGDTGDLAALMSRSSRIEVDASAADAPFSLYYDFWFLPSQVRVPIAYTGSGLGDTVPGTTRDDTIQIGTSEGAAAYILGTRGDDLFDLSGTTGGWVTLDYGGLGQVAPIRAVLDPDTGVATVIGSNFQDRIVGADIAATNAVLAISGTERSDTFEVTTRPGDTVSLLGGRGIDQFTLRVGGTTIVDYGFDDRGLAAGEAVTIDVDAGTARRSLDGATLDVFALTDLGGRFGVKLTEHGDTFRGWSGSDLVIGSRGDDTLDGGAGIDILDYRAPGISLVRADLRTGVVNYFEERSSFRNSRFGTDSVSDFEIVFGGSDNDEIQGAGFEATLDGGGGRDRIYAGTGGGLLIGGAGADTLRGGDGTDVLIGGAEADTLSASHGAWTEGAQDVLAPGLGRNVVYGHAAQFEAGSGGTRMSYFDVDVGLVIEEASRGTGTVRARTGDAVQDSFRWIHDIEGSSGADRVGLVAGDPDVARHVLGLRGADTLVGGPDALASYADDASFGGTRGVVVNFRTGVAKDGWGDLDRLAGLGGALGGAGDDLLVGADDPTRSLRLTGGAGDDTLRLRAAREEIVEQSLADFDGSVIEDFGAGDAIVLRDVLATERDWSITYDDVAFEVRIDLGADGTVDARADLTGTGDWVISTPSDHLVIAAREGIAIDGSDAMGLLRGTAGNDTITGTAGADVIRDRLGDDEVRAGAGDDRIENGFGVDLFDGGAGRDVVVSDLRSLDPHPAGAMVDLRDGLHASGAAIATEVHDTLVGIEDYELRGAWDATLRGDDGANRLVSDAGADVLEGRGGADLLVAGDGADVVRGGDGDDTLDGGGGDDVLVGGDGIDVLRGGAGSDRFNGGAGDDVIRPGLGRDRIDGGGGIDRVRGSSAELDDDIVLNLGHGDQIIFESDRGVRASDIAFDLRPDGILAYDDGSAPSAQLTLLGTFDALSLRVRQPRDATATGFVTAYETDGGPMLGSLEDDWMIGGTAGERIIGGVGDDTLDGRGGADTLIGGVGSDVLHVDDRADRVREDAGWAGTDTVVATVDFLAAGQSIEAIELRGAARIAIGNADDQAITGTDGADRLRGEGGSDTLDGGAGADTLIGGMGGDRIIVRDAEDRVVELAEWDGADTVVSYLDYRFDGEAIEVVELAGDARLGVGDARAQTIAAAPGGSILDGRGGGDTLVGGIGDDTFVIRGADDVVQHAARGYGSDTVRSFISYAAPDEIETLELMNVATAIEGTAAAWRGTVLGNDYDNVLRSGEDKSTLSGGAGADAFHFDYGSRPSLHVAFLKTHTVMDFDAAEGDRLYLDLPDWLGFDAGPLDPDRLIAGTYSSADVPMLVYDASTGRLLVDDGARDSTILYLKNDPAVLDAGDIVIG